MPVPGFTLSNMVLSSSIPTWRDIERLESAEQKRLLQWQLQAREPIHFFADIRTGDHLIKNHSAMDGLFCYEEHFLCIGYKEDKPRIVHYNVSGHIYEIYETYKICEMTLPHKDFIESEEELQAKGNEVQRVVWPEELRRFSVEEFIDRAESRIGEADNNLVSKNNAEVSEMFVMWCICGLPISLQKTVRYGLTEKGIHMLTVFLAPQVGDVDKVFIYSRSFHMQPVYQAFRGWREGKDGGRERGKRKASPSLLFPSFSPPLRPDGAAHAYISPRNVNWRYNHSGA